MTALLAVPSSALADYRQGGGVQETVCYNTVYREEYIPGNAKRPGRVRSWNERVEVPCVANTVPETRTSEVDENSCIEGSVLGGILGGGAGAAASRGDGRWWAIPLGVVGGAMVGCQIDGG